MDHCIKIKKALVGIYILFFCATFAMQGLTVAMDLEQTPTAIVRVHNVGQGNCVVLEVKDKDGNSEYMLVDAGSTAFTKEFQLSDQIPKPDQKISQQTPPHSPRAPISSPPGTVEKSIQIPHTTRQFLEGVER